MLQFNDLWKSFGNKQVLRGLSFEVRPGELFGFCGANGAGKTTAMRIALGMLAADTGQVRWNGQAMGVKQRRRIGYMPEERGLYARMRPAEQLVYLARLSGVRAVVARARVREWLERLDVKLQPKSTLDQLSLGNQQKVQLIAAVIHEPDVLILDEPFSGLDPVATDVLGRVLGEISRDGVPVLFSSHQLDLVERLCQRVGIIHDGTLVTQGPVAELRGEHGRRHLSLKIDGAPPGWPEQLPVGRIVSHGDGRVVAELGPGQALDAVVTAAQRLGTISYLSVVEPSLSDIFRHVVAA